MQNCRRWKVVTIDRFSPTVPRGNKYCNQYERGEIVISLDNTLGLFCFNKMKLAAEWIAKLGRKDLMIIRVIALDIHGVVPSLVSVSDINNFALPEYYGGSNRISIYPPAGTVCYKEIKIID